MPFKGGGKLLVATAAPVRWQQHMAVGVCCIFQAQCPAVWRRLNFSLLRHAGPRRAASLQVH